MIDDYYHSQMHFHLDLLIKMLVHFPGKTSNIYGFFSSTIITKDRVITSKLFCSTSKLATSIKRSSAAIGPHQEQGLSHFFIFVTDEHSRRPIDGENLTKKFQTREMFPNGQTSQNQSLRPDLMSSLSPLGVSLLSPQAPNMLPTLLENSVQSFTNETQHLMAVR